MSSNEEPKTNTGGDDDLKIKKKTDKRDRSRSRSKEREKDRKRDGGSRDRHKEKKHKINKEIHKSKSKKRSKSKEKEKTKKRSRSPSKKKTSRKVEDNKSDKGSASEEQQSSQKQMEQAKRDDCTLLVMHLPFDVNEKEVYKFFNPCGKIRDIRMIKDVRTSKFKGISYIEFYDQDSVMKAMSLSGREFKGSIIKILPSQAEKNRTAAAVKNLRGKNAHDHPSADGPMRIYVGGLNDQLADINEADLRELFSPFGPLDFVDLHKDPLTGRCKGYAFIQYKKSEDAQEAINKMNGLNISGKSIKVSHVQSSSNSSTNNPAASMHNQMLADPNKVDLDDEETGNPYLHSAQSRAMLMQKLTRQPLPDKTEEVLKNPLADIGLLNVIKTVKNVIPSSPSNCIILSNMYSLEEAQGNPEFIQELQDDVFEECRKYGDIRKVKVEVGKEGNVWLRYGDQESAVRAFLSLQGRLFGGRIIQSNYVQESVFNAKFN